MIKYIEPQFFSIENLNLLVQAFENFHKVGNTSNYAILVRPKDQNFEIAFIGSEKELKVCTNDNLNPL